MHAYVGGSVAVGRVSKSGVKRVLPHDPETLVWRVKRRSGGKEKSGVRNVKEAWYECGK